MSEVAKAASPRERILAVASQLFYGQGYRATGINQVIDEANVAKATFYSHFATKDDLCLAYLQGRNRAELAELAEFVERRSTPRSRFLAVTDGIAAWLEANRLRGCGFLNMVSEVPDPGAPIRREGMSHYDGLRKLIHRLAQELVASDAARYRDLEPRRVADEYLVIITGAIALTEIYHDIAPLKQARALARKLID